MGVGDAVRRLIDPINPAVEAWLKRELPRLVQAGVITAPQADAIAQRYGLTPLVSPGEVRPVAAAPVAAFADEAIAPAAREAAGLVGTPSIDAGERYGGEIGPQSGEASTERTDAMPSVPSIPAQAPQPGQSPFLADHAVSIVLYLGAFLVITAAAIFLAYSWGDIQGTTKLGLLMAATAGFLGVAALCLRYPSVQLAGRTFLAIGAILVPANVAAAYLLVFTDGPIPAAVFWLVGAVLSGGLHGTLSYRLRSRAYGVLATLSVPVAACAITWLIVPEAAWFGPASALALAATLAASRWRPGPPLAQSARAVAAGLLVLTPFIALPDAVTTNEAALALPVTFFLAIGTLAWEALRRGWTWWVGAAACLLLVPFVAIALTGTNPRPALVLAIVVTCWIAVDVARQIGPGRAPLWDLAATIPALVYPSAAWAEDRSSAVLFANAIVLAAAQAYVRRSPLPLYAAVLAADALYIKLLDIFCSPDSPAWALGVALWPVGLAWGALALVAPRRVAAPFATGALITFLGAALLTVDQTKWNAGISLSAAALTVAVAWRLRMGVILLAAAPWLLAGAYQAGAALQIEQPYRLAATGLGGWLLFAISLRPPRPVPATVTVEEPSATEPAGPPAAVTSSEAASATDEAQAVGSTASDEASETDVWSAGDKAPTRVPASSLLRADWALWARVAALVVTGFAAILVLAVVGAAPEDRWLRATMLAWIDLGLLLGAWAWITRSRDLGVAAALSLVPAILAGIMLLHPGNAQAYAIPIGLYLLALAFVIRRDRRGHRGLAANAVAGVGMLVLLGTGIVQALDRNDFVYTLWTLAEGLILTIVGIAVRWRALVIGGVAGVVVIALRQLFDAVSALPGWAILGGSGLLLLGLAVLLLVARARLAAAGRAAAERWSTWD